MKNNATIRTVAGVAVIAGAVLALPAVSFASPGWHPDRAALDDPATHSVTVGDAKANGNGCPTGTQIRTEGNVVTINFEGAKMLAGAGGPSDLADARKNCQVSIPASAPAGHTVGVKSVKTSAEAWIEPDANAKLSHAIYVQGSSDTVRTSTPLAGGTSGRVSHTTAPDGGVVWAPCGAARNINVATTLQVDASPVSKDDYSWIWAEDGHTQVELVTKPCS